MAIIEVLFPVLAMLALGMFCRKMQFLTGEQVNGLKFLTAKVILPVAIFHALATADYSLGTLKIVAIMLIMLVVSFSAGFLMKKLVKPPHQKYVPFLVSIYEGGLMAYPLYTNLCGAENLSQMALLDIAGLIFGFSIYMGMLSQVEEKNGIDVKKLCTDCLHNPAFLASVFGILAGVSGVIKMLIDSPFGTIYTDTQALLTAPLSSIILLVVGFGLEPKLELLGPCLQTIFLRVALQVVMTVGVVWAVHHFTEANPLMDLAIIIYMSAPPSFSMQSFMKNEAACAFVSTINSLYCLISILVYGICAVFI